MPILRSLWQRFLLLSWVGKGIAVFVVLYGIGWVFGSLGMDSTARSFGGAGIAVLSVMITWLIIRFLWRKSTEYRRR
jgi:membrane protein DedA with SNARE-associated domain